MVQIIETEVFFLFAWNSYEAQGGMSDFAGGTYDTIDEAKEAFAERHFTDNGQIVSAFNYIFKIVCEYGTWGHDIEPSWRSRELAF